MDSSARRMPSVALGSASMVLAVLWFLVWPEDRVGGDTGGLERAVLRWGHGLVWLLLAAMWFLKASRVTALRRPSDVCGYLAGASYLVFLWVFLVSAQPGPSSA